MQLDTFNIKNFEWARGVHRYTIRNMRIRILLADSKCVSPLAAMISGPTKRRKNVKLKITLSKKLDLHAVDGIARRGPERSDAQENLISTVFCFNSYYNGHGTFLDFAIDIETMTCCDFMGKSAWIRIESIEQCATKTKPHSISIFKDDFSLLDALKVCDGDLIHNLIQKMMHKINAIAHCETIFDLKTNIV